MDKMNRPHRFRGDLQFQKQVHDRTRAALLQKEADFARIHRDDSDEQLLEYVRICSRELGKAPHAGEIIGGTYIAARLQGWDRVISAAGLPQPLTIPAFEHRSIYKAEYRAQEQLLRKEQTAGKDAARAQRRRKDAEGRARELARQERDRAWGRAHERDTDAQLLEYIRVRAAELEHAPVAQEVPGAAYIAGRFGSWAVALTVAGLPLPEGVKPPNPKTLKAYREKVRAAAAGAEQK